jgi:hypothetical protein
MNVAYWMEPADVKFDTNISKFNPPKSRENYLSLKTQIKNSVQTQPILMRGNLCGDGTHRNQVAKELGRKVLAIDVDKDMPDKEFILLCNQNTFTARNPSVTQLAIQAYKLVETYGYSDVEAIKNVGLPNGTKVVGYVRTVAHSPTGKALNIIEELHKGNKVTIDGKTTSSIENAKKIIAAYEARLLETEEDEIELEPVSIDYNLVIGTETGKKLFWRIMGQGLKNTVGTDIKLSVISLINTIYKTGDEDISAKASIEEITVALVEALETLPE